MLSSPFLSRSHGDTSCPRNMHSLGPSESRTAATSHSVGLFAAARLATAILRLLVSAAIGGHPDIRRAQSHGGLTRSGLISQTIMTTNTIGWDLLCGPRDLRYSDYPRYSRRKRSSALTETQVLCDPRVPRITSSRCGVDKVLTLSTPLTHPCLGELEHANR